ncbi:MAG: hypothetical protein ACOY82_04895 [Pseudomonadota bacterium]
MLTGNSADKQSASSDARHAILEWKEGSESMERGVERGERGQSPLYQVFGENFHESRVEESTLTSSCAIPASGAESPYEGLMRLGSFLACLILGFLTCASAPASTLVFYGPVYSSYKKKLESGGGCISGSIGTTVPAKLKLSVNFVSEKNSDSTLKLADVSFLSYNKPGEHAIMSGALRADVFTMCLKPGRYHLVGITALGQYNSTRVHIPFDVEAGKHMYVGSFILHGAGGQPADCGPPELPMFVEIRDEHARDIPLIMKAKNPVGVEPVSAIIRPSAGNPISLHVDDKSRVACASSCLYREFSPQFCISLRSGSRSASGRKSMARKLRSCSAVGPLLLGPMPRDAREKLRLLPSLKPVQGASDLPAGWTPEQKAHCVAVCSLIEAYLRNPASLEGVCPGFRLIFLYSNCQEATADARSVQDLLGTPTAQVAEMPSYLIRIDASLVALTQQASADAIFCFGDADLGTIFDIPVPDRRKIALHVCWMTLMQVFFHELGHVLRGHFRPGRTLPAGVNLPPDVGSRLLDELDADLFSNAALAVLLRSAIGKKSSSTDVGDRYRFAIGALAGRTLFGLLAQRYGTTPSITHPAHSVRAAWTVHDMARLFDISPHEAEMFLSRFRCDFGTSFVEIRAEVARQQSAWEIWKPLQDAGYFKADFA